MADYQYAKGRIEESIDFISREIEEFERDYSSKDWREYKEDTKLQKLIDRTIENILTALIEIGGTILAEEGVSGRSYAEVLRKIGEFFHFPESDQDRLADLAAQRNRLAHRYLNYRWEAVKAYKNSAPLIKRLLLAAIDREKNKNTSFPK